MNTKFTLAVNRRQSYANLPCVTGVTNVTNVTFVAAASVTDVTRAIYGPCHVTQRCQALGLVAVAQPCAVERAGGSILTPRSSLPTADCSEALTRLDACGARP